MSDTVGSFIGDRVEGAWDPLSVLAGSGGREQRYGEIEGGGRAGFQESAMDAAEQVSVNAAARAARGAVLHQTVDNRLQRNASGSAAVAGDRIVVAAAGRSTEKCVSLRGKRERPETGFEQSSARDFAVSDASKTFDRTEDAVENEDDDDDDDGIIHDAITDNKALMRSAVYSQEHPVTPASTSLVVGLGVTKRKKKAVRARVGDLSPEFIHSCPFEGCTKKFAKKYNLKIHVRRHAGDLPFQCEMPDCQKRFMWHSSFQRHQRSHDRRPKGKRRKVSAGEGAGPRQSVGVAASHLEASMIPSQILLGNGTGPEVPESILSAIVNAGGGTPFDENSALHSAQLFCTGPSTNMQVPHLFEGMSSKPGAAAAHHQNQNRLRKAVRVDVAARVCGGDQMQTGTRNHQYSGKQEHNDYQFSLFSTPRDEVGLNSLAVASHLLPVQPLPPSAHNAHNATQLSPSDLSQLFSPMSDVAAFDILQAGLEENHNTNFTNIGSVPTPEMLPQNTLPNLPVSSSPASRASSADALKEDSKTAKLMNHPSQDGQPSAGHQEGNEAVEQVEFGLDACADFEESFAFLLDSVR
jgi:hypothetical protein